VIYDHSTVCAWYGEVTNKDCPCREEEGRYLHLARWSFILFGGLFIVALLSKSKGGVSSAIHQLLDGMENVVSALIANLALQSENERKLRWIGGIVSAFIMICGGLGIIYEGYQHLLIQHPVSFWVVISESIGLGVNRWQHTIHNHAPKEHQNVTHWWQNFHLWSDMATTGVVIASWVVMFFTGWWHIDGYISIAIGGFITVLTIIRLFLKTPHDH